MFFGGFLCVFFSVSTFRITRFPTTFSDPPTAFVLRFKEFIHLFFPSVMDLPHFPAFSSSVAFSKTSQPLSPSHLHGSHLKKMFYLSFTILFIPPFFNLDLRLACSLACSEVSGSSGNFIKLLISAVSSNHSFHTSEMQIFIL